VVSLVTLQNFNMLSQFFQDFKSCVLNFKICDNTQVGLVLRTKSTCKQKLTGIQYLFAKAQEKSKMS